MRNYIINIVIMIAMGILTSIASRGQTVSVPFTFSGSSPVSLQMDQYGDLFAFGSINVGSIPNFGIRTRMFWSPAHAAFRAGDTTTSAWDDENLGGWSAAFGSNTMASGVFTIAAGGGGTTASGAYDVAMGNDVDASGSCSTAFGCNSIASGDESFAEGFYSTSTGQASFASGISAIAGGYESVALGGGYASGDNAVAIEGAAAYGQYAFAWGRNVSSSAYLDFGIGTWNVGGGNPTSWVATDPIFEVGNGTPNNHSDALLITKNGNAQLQGSLRCSPGGDLSMGSFTAGTNPSSGQP